MWESSYQMGLYSEKNKEYKHSYCSLDARTTYLSDVVQWEILNAGHFCDSSHLKKSDFLLIGEIPRSGALYIQKCPYEPHFNFAEERFSCIYFCTYFQGYIWDYRAVHHTCSGPKELCTDVFWPQNAFSGQLSNFIQHLDFSLLENIWNMGMVDLIIHRWKNLRVFSILGLYAQQFICFTLTNPPAVLRSDWQVLY